MAKDEEKKKIKIKWTKKNNIVATVIVLAVVVGYVYLFYVPKLVTSVNYNGIILNFRVDLREAEKVPVKPGTNEVAVTVENAWVQNVTIVYRPTGDTAKDKYYNLEAFEIANKLKTAFLVDGLDIGVDSQPLSVYNRTTYYMLPGQIQHPLIAIMLPEDSNETLVYAAPEHVVYISAISYKDLDLAVAKFLISALKINL